MSVMAGPLVPLLRPTGEEDRGEDPVDPWYDKI